MLVHSIGLTKTPFTVPSALQTFLLSDLMKYQKGSEWRKWDLHVHTPYSMVNEYRGATEEEKWEQFISDLEMLPEEFKVLGINDYLFIDGYEKILEYRSKGRLTNIDTIFPVIEFRIKKFGGNRVFKRVNFHVIFSDKVPVATIKQQFLNQLYGSYVLAPGAEGTEWRGFIDKDSLTDLGRAIKESIPAERADQYGSDIFEGFNNINFDEEFLIDNLNKSTYLRGKFLTAIGKTEWDSFSWNDNSIAEKKTVINRVDFVFTSSENIDAFNNAKAKLLEQNVNSLLLDCSDAHRNSNSRDKDRIGKCFTWIKADPSFEGLKQVLNENDRICVTGVPELLDRIAGNPNKFIKSISVRRVANTSMQEVWYDDIEIPLNPSLVAIIGNKGNGKSALTDIVGLLGNSHNESYSFLTKKKFRNPRPYNKSSNIEAKISWADNTEDGYLKLDANVDLNKAEKVKYIPQNFLETLCVSEEEDEFESEIRKIIFAHTDESERLGFSTLDEIINFKSEIIHKELGEIKTEIDDLNQKIVLLERKTTGSYLAGLAENLRSKETELEMHATLRPVVVVEPNADSDLRERNGEINAQIAKIKEQITQKVLRQSELTSRKTILNRQISQLEKSKQTFLALQNSILASVDMQRSVLAEFGISVDEVFRFNMDISSIQNGLDERLIELSTISAEIDGELGVSPGLTTQILNMTVEQKTLEEKLDEPYRLYQKYLKDIDEWNKRRDAIVGDRFTTGTIDYLKDQIDYVSNRLPAELTSHFERRDALIRRLFGKKSEINQLYSESYRPISNFIDNYGHLMKDYEINFSVEFILDGFIQKFFDHISQGAKGTYIGVEEGNRYLSDLILNFNLNDADGLISFLQSINESLHVDKRVDQTDTKRDIEQQLKKGYDVEDLYRFLYNLEYLRPSFKLNLGNKGLSELSPGERGALLLIFYLFLDKDDKPLIIDQPEENLDNQSVYNYLVHFIKEAKKRRQILIVTHNPNLAVVCDAEQVIHMSINKAHGNSVSYLSGSIENQVINKSIVDILEGTKPAFGNRTSKYSLG